MARQSPAEQMPVAFHRAMADPTADQNQEIQARPARKESQRRSLANTAKPPEPRWAMPQSPMRASERNPATGRSGHKRGFAPLRGRCVKAARSESKNIRRERIRAKSRSLRILILRAKSGRRAK